MPPAVRFSLVFSLFPLYMAASWSDGLLPGESLKMETRHMASPETFSDMVDDLGAIYSNLATPTDRQIEIWYRHFADVDDDVLRAAIDRLIRDHRESRVTPAHLYPFVAEVWRDRNREVDDHLMPICTDKNCTQCLGTGRYHAQLNISGFDRSFTLICVAKDSNG